MASNKEHFKITSICREDLIGCGYKNAYDLTDEQMTILAEKMENAYLENGFWTDLESCAEYYLGLKKS